MRPVESRIIRPLFKKGITKYYTDIHADLIYGPIGYDAISCFRSTFIEVLNTAENAAASEGVEF